MAESPEAQLKDADKRRGENESQQKGNFLNHRLVLKCLILVTLLSTNDVNWAFLRSTGTAGIFSRVQEGKSYSPDNDSQGKGKANDESLLESFSWLTFCIKQK